MDLAELQTLSGFLMNETPDSSGHFYPPWASDADSSVKDEPLIADDFEVCRPQQQMPLRPNGGHAGVAPASDTKVEVSVGVDPSAAIVFRGVNNTATVNRLVASGGPGSTLKKTAAGGVTRRRSSSKEEQAKKRRERNRVLARRTRLRKKFFFQSLQQQVCGLVPCNICTKVALLGAGAGDERILAFEGTVLDFSEHRGLVTISAVKNGLYVVGVVVWLRWQESVE